MVYNTFAFHAQVLHLSYKQSRQWALKYQESVLGSAGYQQVQKYTIVQTSSSEYSPTGLLAGQPGTEPAMSWLIISVLVTL